MLMNELLKTKLFSLLSEPSQVTNQETEYAYGCFMEQLRTIVSQPETDYSAVFRMLNTTRIELAFLKSLYRYEQGEKCLEISLSSKNFSPYQC